MSEAEDQFQPQCVDTLALRGFTMLQKTACSHTSASFYGSDRLVARAQRQSPREQMQLDTLTPEPLRQVPRKTQLMLARCTPRLALAPRSPQAWWLALRATVRLQIVFDLGGTTFTTSGGDDNGVVTAGASATYSLYSRSRDAFLSSSIIPSVGLDLNETRVIKGRSSLSIE